MAGTLAGPLIGGNLCLISHLVGTELALDFNDAIAFIEEVGERPYAIDRMLTHLHLAGSLKSSAAFAVGDLLHCEEKIGAPKPTASEAIDERLDRRAPRSTSASIDERLRAFGLPAIAGLPIGHGKRNLAVPFGAQCELDFDRCELRLFEPAVA